MNSLIGITIDRHGLMVTVIFALYRDFWRLSPKCVQFRLLNGQFW